MSAFVVNFNAFAFTGAAAKYFQTGLLFLLLAAVFQLTYVLLFLFAERFPRLRVVTGLDVVGLRFGRVTENFFAFYRIPIGLLLAGIGLAVTGNFFAAALGISVLYAILITGVFTVLISAAGGSWAVVASDFVQGLVMLGAVCLLSIHLCFEGPFGGLGGLVNALSPAIETLPSQLADPTLLIWMGALIAYQLVIRLHLIDEGNRFLLANSEADCKKIVIMIVVATSIAIPLLAFPPIAAATLNPDLASSYPMLKSPEEAATIWVAANSLPAGSYGLFLVGVLASAMTTMDSGLNKNVGFFVVNLYQQQISPNASDSRLIRLSRLVTLLFGGIVIGIAVVFEQVRTSNLFDQTLRLHSLVTIPFAVPLGLGLFFTKTPSWSGWSSALVGTFAAVAVEFLLPAEFIASYCFAVEPTSNDLFNLKASMNIIASLLFGSGWFFATGALFKDKTPTKFEALSRKALTDDEKSTESESRSQKQWFGQIVLFFGVCLFVPLCLCPTRQSFLSLGSAVVVFIVLGVFMCLSGGRRRQ